jgi:hypothetical protein
MILGLLVLDLGLVLLVLDLGLLVLGLVLGGGDGAVSE